MGKTATELGREFGRTAREMNKLLKEHSFMEGEPGAYRTTELGKPFVQAHDFDNGYGGFAHRQWGWLSWTDGLADVLRASMEANPNGIPAPVLAPDAAVANIKPGPGGHLFNKNQWFAAVALVGLAVSAPVAKRAWHEKVKPTASRARTRIAERKSAKSAAGAAEHDRGSSATQATEDAAE